MGPQRKNKRILGVSNFKYVSNQLNISRWVSNIGVWLYIFFWFFYVQKLVTGLTVRENDQIYEILGWPLIDPATFGMHRASREGQTSRVACLASILILKTVLNVSAWRLDSQWWGCAPRKIFRHQTREFFV